MRPGQKHYVYIMTNRHRNVLYIGVTNNLKRRVSEHENGFDNGFSLKYNCNYLVYFEEYRSINKAIKREKEIKGGVKHPHRFALQHQTELILLPDKQHLFIDNNMGP